MAQQQQTRAMLVNIDPETGRLEFTARPTNTRGLALINLCYDAITDYEERQRVLDAVSKSPAGQYQQVEQARLKAVEQHSAAKESVIIMMRSISEHFWMAPDDEAEPTADDTALDEPVLETEPSDSAPDVQTFPEPENVDFATVTKRKQSRLLSKPIPWITITISRDLAQNRPTKYGEAMNRLLKDATDMLASHDEIVKPQKRRSGKSPIPADPNPDQQIADNLLDTAEQTLATFVIQALTAKW